MFNHHAFRDRVRLSGVNSINWARIVAQAVYYFTAAVALGAPHRKVAFTVPTGNFGDVYRRLCRAAHGPADRPAGGGDQRQRHPRAHLRHRRPTRSRDVIATALAVDGHPGVVEFRAAVVRGLWPRRRRGARADGLAGAVAALLACRRGAQGDARAVLRRPRRRAGNRRHHARLDAGSRLLRRSAYRGRRWRWPRRKRAIRPCRWWCCRPRIRPNSPMRSRRLAACTPALPDWLADLPKHGRARHRAAGRSGGRSNDLSSTASRAAREGAAA